MIFSFQGFAMPPINQARALLSHLREGDYTHPGDQEAIDLVLPHILKLLPEAKEGPTLDLGSGFGGTADYFYNKGFRSLYGIDIDAGAIAHAKEHYRNVDFLEANAYSISKIFPPNYFSLIYLFSVFYAIEDKALLLENLFSVAKPGALLTIFDYTANHLSGELKDLAGKSMHPMILSETKKQLQKAGWEIVEIIDLSSEFKRWYATFLDKLKKEKDSLKTHFPEEIITKVETTFQSILSQLESNQLGAVALYAKKSELSLWK
jgi:SAM-dependent methyltransferase